MWWLLASLAAAGPGLDACCRAAGAPTCPSEIEAVGPGSYADGNGQRGLWSLPCDGPTRFHGDRATTLSGLGPGSVVTPLDPASSRCFDASCRLPSGLCLSNAGGRYRLARCSDGTEASATVWSAGPRSPYGAAVVAGRVLNGAPRTLAAAAPPPVMPSSAVAPVSLDTTVPAPPPDRCVPNPALRQPSIDQVDAGNEAMVGGDWALAADKYRAAITIDQCNGFAWSSLADALLQTGHPQEARQAAVPATALTPRSAHPWTILGRAAQATGDRITAIEAFEKALSIQPGHPQAAAALSQLR